MMLRVFISSVQKELEIERVSIAGKVSGDRVFSQICNMVLYDKEPLSGRRVAKCVSGRVGACGIFTVAVIGNPFKRIGKVSWGQLLGRKAGWVGMGYKQLVGQAGASYPLSLDGGNGGRVDSLFTQWVNTWANGAIAESTGFSKGNLPDKLSRQWHAGYIPFKRQELSLAKGWYASTLLAKEQVKGKRRVMNTRLSLPTGAGVDSSLQQWGHNGDNGDINPLETHQYMWCNWGGGPIDTDRKGLNCQTAWASAFQIGVALA